MLPSQLLRAIGIRFSLKSPAVASMDRHWPAADLRETEEKALVAVSSLGFASAAADGFSTPPALATEVVSLVGVCATAALGAGVVTDVSELAGAGVAVDGMDGAGEAGAGAAELSPKVKDWFASPVLHEA